MKFPASPARFRTAVAVAALLAGAAVSGCHTFSDALGTSKLAPDEFRVVTKAPLVVPPEYALRPPVPGEPRPQELQPESQARQALLGERDSADRSEGEKLLADRAGAQNADPLIRYVVDDQYGDIAHKDKSFADRVMFWRKGQPENAAASAEEQAADTPNPVDPAVVQKTVASLTGGKDVIIQRAPAKRHIKLPGL
jgi:hypothetical protein